MLSLAEIRDYDPQATGHRFCCPLCGDDKPRDQAHRSLGVDLERGLYHCFRCDAAGVLEEFKNGRDAAATGREAKTRRLRRVFDLTPENPPAGAPATPLTAPTSVDTVSPTPSPDASTGEPAGKKKQGISLPDVAAGLLALNSAAGERGRTYLARRGLESMIALCNVDKPSMAAPVSEAANTTAGEALEMYWHPRYLGRPALLFPLRDMAGRVVGWHGRYVDGRTNPKSRTVGEKKQGAWATPGAWRTDYLPALILTEAPLDALSLHAAGFPAIALCGTTGPQWLHRRTAFQRVLLAFDADDAGDAQAAKLAAQLSPFGARCTRLRPQDAKDWNEQLTRGGLIRLADFLAAAVLVE